MTHGTSHTQAQPTPWPDDVIARYLTVAGATVDITYASHSGLLVEACTACSWTGTTDTGGLLTDPPEKEDARVQEWLPVSEVHAQAHAEKCRALPRPAVS